MGSPSAGAAAGWGDSISRAKDAWHGSSDGALDGIPRTRGGGGNCVGRRVQLGRYRADIGRAQFQTKIVAAVWLDEITTRAAQEILQRFWGGVCASSWHRYLRQDRRLCNHRRHG